MNRPGCHPGCKNIESRPGAPNPVQDQDLGTNMSFQYMCQDQYEFSVQMSGGVMMSWPLIVYHTKLNLYSEKGLRYNNFNFPTDRHTDKEEYRSS